MSTRKMMDCRLYPSEKHCTLTITGKEKEVLDAAFNHAVSAHGHKKSPALRRQLRALLRDDRASR